MNAKKRWMETPCDIEIIRQYAQAGKPVASFGKRETIARKAIREELLVADSGDSWYVGYDAMRLQSWEMDFTINGIHGIAELIRRQNDVYDSSFGMHVED